MLNHNEYEKFNAVFETILIPVIEEKEEAFEKILAQNIGLRQELEIEMQKILREREMDAAAESEIKAHFNDSREMFKNYSRGNQEANSMITSTTIWKVGQVNKEVISLFNSELVSGKYIAEYAHQEHYNVKDQLSWWLKKDVLKTSLSPIENVIHQEQPTKSKMSVMDIDMRRNRSYNDELNLPISC